jgi:hypothetical protein
VPPLRPVCWFPLQAVGAGCSLISLPGSEAAVVTVGGTCNFISGGDLLSETAIPGTEAAVPGAAAGAIRLSA